MESSIHGLSEPHVFAVLGLAGPPILARDAGRFGADTGLACLHVAEDLDRVHGAALVGVNPVLSCGPTGRPKRTLENRLQLSLSVGATSRIKEGAIFNKL